jgi:hypothetical protein
VDARGHEPVRVAGDVGEVLRSGDEVRVEALLAHRPADVVVATFVLGVGEILDTAKGGA